MEFLVTKIDDNQVVDVKKIATAKLDGRTVVFVLTGDGSIHVIGRHSIRLDSQFGCNDATRRAFCKLSGHKLSEIKASMAKRAAADKKRIADIELDTLKRRAEKLDYRLVKTRKPKSQC